MSRHVAIYFPRLQPLSARQRQIHATWDYFTSPGQRPKWRGAEQVIATVDRGRRGVGTVNHCMQGQQSIIEEVLDWRPG